MLMFRFHALDLAAYARDLIFHFEDVGNLTGPLAKDFGHALLRSAGVGKTRFKVLVLLGDLLAVLRLRVDVSKLASFRQEPIELTGWDPQGSLQGSARAGWSPDIHAADVASAPAEDFF